MLFPNEIWELILDRLPPSTHQDQTGPITLARISQTCTLLNEIVNGSSLWRRHYRSQWLHSDPVKESLRRDIYEDNFKAMYMARLDLDTRAEACLKKIVTAQRIGVRHENASILVNSLGYDVWDFTNSLSHLPLSVQYRNHLPSTSYPDALTVRFWANEVKNLIIRRIGISCWTNLLQACPTETKFEEAMLLNYLEILGSNCKTSLENAGVVCDADMPDYSLVLLVGKICDWMRVQGFDRPTDEAYHDVAIHFPHLFLTTHRRSLPMSLVCVFISITRHFNLHASPINFPAKVIAHIAEPEGAGIWVDVYGSATRCVIDIHREIQNVLGYVDEETERAWMNPASIPTMLLRTSHNIYRSIGANAPGDRDELCFRGTAVYVVGCITAIFAGRLELLTVILDQHDDLFLLDEKAIFLDTILRFLGDNPEVANATLHAHRNIARPRKVKRRSGTKLIKYSVGMIVRHKEHDYVGVIHDWDPTCSRSADRVGVVDGTTPRGRDQPFYNIYPSVGSQRYAAEDNLEPIRLTIKLAHSLLKNNAMIGQYFSRLDIPALDADPRILGGFIPTEFVKAGYPEDEEFLNKTYA